MNSKSDQLKVFIPNRESTCDECGENLGRRAWITLQGEAEHACRKYSGRVGRSSAAKAPDAEAVRLAVLAHSRHVEPPYDDLLAAMHARSEARMMVRDAVAEILDKWQ